ncbi:MAG: 1-deoxy-D-xylulose-5-phosphate reductoisomerase [Candidatus Nanopelagicales bacterium]
MSNSVSANRRSVALLGSTGSIGTQALDVIRRNRGQFDVVGLSAGGANIDTLVDQILEFRPQLVAVASEESAFLLTDNLIRDTRSAQVAPFTGKIIGGPEAATEVAAMGADVVLNGITGSVGLEPTLAALESGATLALANKESLVVGGSLVTRTARAGQIVPVDSEHSALAQCLRSGTPSEVKALVLTASGGPFRGRKSAELAEVSPAEALNHPTWDMGPVVTINSASLMNKGLEVIEAHLLFGIDYEAIKVVVHPQSIIHSMVEFVDGSTIAQASPPDMRLPIALGLSWPERLPRAISPINWGEAAEWTFEPLDNEAFPAVDLARYAGSLAGTAPAVFNAANEECVASFLAGNLAFTRIVPTVREVLDTHVANASSATAEVANATGASYVKDSDLSLSAVLEAELWARDTARGVAS